MLGRRAPPHILLLASHMPLPPKRSSMSVLGSGVRGMPPSPSHTTKCHISPTPYPMPSSPAPPLRPQPNSVGHSDIHSHILSWSTPFYIFPPRPTHALASPTLFALRFMTRGTGSVMSLPVDHSRRLPPRPQLIQYISPLVSPPFRAFPSAPQLP